MAQLFTNNATTKLSTGIDAVTTSVVVVDGSKFPSPTGGDYFYITVSRINGSGQEDQWEIMKCTSRTTNTLTVVRAQDNTTAVSAVAGSPVELRQVAQTISNPDLNSLTVKNNINNTALTASSAVATDASKNLVSVPTTGTGSYVLSNSPTLVTPNLGTPTTLVGTNITGTASGLTAGTVTTNANLTGDVTSAGNTTTIGANKVTLAKIAQVATSIFLGRVSVGTGNVEEVTVASAKTMLGISNVDNTSDANKPLSTAETTALALKQNLSDKDASGGYVGLTTMKINFRNALNTITSFFTNANTVARTYTFPDKDGTVAMTSDITGTNSGTNTGDETTATIKSKLGITTLSGSNTGDQTTISGNAGSATRIAFNDRRAVNQTPGYFGAGADWSFMANATDGLADGGTYHGVMHFQPYTDASGGGAYELGFTDNNNLWIRGSSGGLTSWASWKKIIDNSNVGNYAPSLTGTGASGTWGINITGTAGSVAWGNVSGRPTAVSSFTNDSGYVTSGGTVANATNATNSTNATNLTGTASTAGYSTSSASVAYGGIGGPQVMGQGGGAAMLSFHRPGSYAINFGLDTDNVLKVGGWSMGAVSYAIMHSGNIGSQSVNYATTAGSAPANGGTSSYSTYQWSTSHSGTYYVSNAWNGTYWRFTSNHGAGISVTHADYANSAGSISGGLKTIGGQSLIGSGDLSMIKSVQHGSTAVGVMSVNVTISAVNTSKAFVVANVAGTPPMYDPYGSVRQTGGGAYFASTGASVTSLTIEGNGNFGVNTTIHWSVIEYY